MRISPLALALPALLAGTLPGTSAIAETRSPDRPCVAGRPSLTVEVNGFNSTTGLVRAQLYGPGGSGFLDKGRWTMRIEQRRSGGGPMRFCFPIERPGRYAVAIRHDANGNGHSDWSDGGGFTGNPKLSILKLKPSFDASAVAVDERPVVASVTMQYRRGLSIGPVDR